MTELLPNDQAEALTSSLLEFLATTFSLDVQTQESLRRFLTDEQTGMFQGPYVRLRLPFAPAAPGWEESLPNRPEKFTPYGHQAAAFRRLSSANGHQPQPTVVTTGTGSGKTESFLYPILDHVARANAAGESGMKALILYPMNALANDQARRLTDLLMNEPEYQGITAALYTGESSESGRTKVTPNGLITNREVIRSKAPDILLTNYKMLDQLLLRHADAGIWQQSAKSLAYLVIDEFHSYDGAQGTDVAMLLRRLGLALNTGAGSTGESPLGRVTPVATSATLGDDGDPAAMLNFFHTVTGCDANEDSAITETRLSYDAWAADLIEGSLDLGLVPLKLTKDLAFDLIEALESSQLSAQSSRSAGIATDPKQAVRVIVSHLFTRLTDEGIETGYVQDLPDLESAQVLGLLASHPLTKKAVEASAAAISLSELTERLFGTETRRAVDAGVAGEFTGIFLSVISHLRAVYGRGAIAVDVHVWVRELTRIDRILSSIEPNFRWTDDGILEDEATPALPAIYCRSCGRSGWGALLEPTGMALEKKEESIRRKYASGDERFRPLLFAPGEGQLAVLTPNDSGGPENLGLQQEDPIANLLWLNVRDKELQSQPKYDEEESAAWIPVLTHFGTDAGKKSKNDVCPACGTRGAIRFLGSAIATQLSVTLSGLLATSGMEDKERRALVFTDSVQDAAHRAGFVQSRSYALTLRTLMRECLEEGPLSLVDLAPAMINKSGSDATRRYALLPPELADRARFSSFWQYPKRNHPPLRRRVETRLSFDVEMEFGLRSRVGRTLEATGAAVCEFNVDHRLLERAAREATESVGQTKLSVLAEGTEAPLGWVIGVLEHMRTRGAISHPWWDKYLKEAGARWWITGGRRHKQDGMPGFRPGVSAPSFPVSGPKTGVGEDLEPVDSARGWYAMWTAKTLQVPRSEAASISKALFERLTDYDVVASVVASSGHVTYALRPEGISVRAVTDQELDSAALELECAVCQASLHASPEMISILDGGPCLLAQCTGQLRSVKLKDNYYRRMYSSRSSRRIVAREHTSLLPNEIRQSYEDQFKSPVPMPDAPNVLVATPTLEMGIDIGDLSTVMLSSLPRSVASYLQRVGRAGRLTGNALTIAFVTAKGDQLPKYFHPNETIDGAVRPPATYLDALEILKRQYLASAGDLLARDYEAPHPRNTSDALRSVDEGSYLARLIETGQETITFERFIGVFKNSSGSSSLREESIQGLRLWALGDDSPAPEKPLKTGLASRCERASSEWNSRLEELGYRLAEIEKVLPDLQQRASVPAADQESKTAFNTARATQRLTRREITELKSEYWISAMESYGLYPNYTLIDDSVNLDASISWVDPDSGDYQTDELSVVRASARALKEFAPGSTFYTQGYAIDIDAIDVGSKGEHIHMWACCPACGYVLDRGYGASGSLQDPLCPRCGDSGLGNMSQQIPVVQLKNVSAAIRRDEAVIDDRGDERRNAAYRIATLADIDVAKTTSWYVEGSEFGVRHSREIAMNWMNLGSYSAKGADFEIGGFSSQAPLFRVCERCGKLDEESGMNTPREHRPWCAVRHDAKEHVVAVALARSLTTEGLVLRIPQSEVIGESSAMPSLQAALLLALREHLGGSPDHLSVAAISDPTGESDGNPMAALIYDSVPGGTGYLSELGEPEKLAQILVDVYRYLANCQCADTELLACERCLLPFAPTHDIQNVSRVAALRILGAILGVDETGKIPDDVWPVITKDEPAPSSSESYLEQNFRKVLRERVRDAGGSIKESQGNQGSIWRIDIRRRSAWRMEPQANVLGTRPDFLFSSGNPNLPLTAIYTDGQAYHFSKKNNRVLDDSEKRGRLREGGYRVLSLTTQDLELANGGSFTPSWYSDQVTSALMIQGVTGLSRADFKLLSASPVELLLKLLNEPDFNESFTALAQWIPFYFFFVGDQVQLAPGQSLVNATFEVLTKEETFESGSDGTARQAAIWRRGTFAVGATPREGSETNFELVVMLDDRDDQVGPENAESWREWLHLANLVGGRMDPTVITTTGRIVSDRENKAVSQSAHIQETQALRPVNSLSEPKSIAEKYSGSSLPPSWRMEVEDLLDEEREVIENLLKTFGVELPEPELGVETADGVPLDLTWSEWKIAANVREMDPKERDVLERAGWRVFAAAPQALASEIGKHVEVR